MIGTLFIRFLQNAQDEKKIDSNVLHVPSEELIFFFHSTSQLFLIVGDRGNREMEQSQTEATQHHRNG